MNEYRTMMQDAHSGAGERVHDTPEVTVVMPCLNEAASVGTCVREALGVLRESGIDGEVVVCDNGSVDGSARLAQQAGATVLYERRPGYGSAYLRAFQEVRGRYIIMADADGTYDLRMIPEFLALLRDGYDLVMGARQYSRGATTLLHRYVGVPLLTGFLNVVAGHGVSDAHCGMRGVSREALMRLHLTTTGMEFASEMIIKAVRLGMKITEIPIPYYARAGESKLRTFRDGWRHMRFILLASPTLLFVVPGLLMMFSGLAALVALAPGRIQIGHVSFDFHYMVVAALLTILGWQVLSLGLFARVFSVTEGFARPDATLSRFIRHFNLEKMLAGSALVWISGLALLVWVLVSWIGQGFGFAGEIMLRPALLGMTLFVVGVGASFSSFFMSALLADREWNLRIHPAREQGLVDGMPTAVRR